MQLKEWRLTHGKTMSECASLFGLDNARTYQRYETGENRPDADLVERFSALTDRSVGAVDMHETRLAWLRENQPAKFKHDEAAA
ncbi:hypothetical protein [Mesorhizobium sp.]|uniref:hypothetical protein n=1 Tax=Mesorhizobium sp. TaxID=1871066 RepID=UPI000FE8610A|nr:hypothetical protein [Mesorhizobium sp.]RWN11785.1 MAG: XRE family transcriptional regulator [Mesorhizobium sp.]RWN19428.1 MAG: XRE family transcriptional regulator [Mesorhizobium sp.]TIN84331.1 MAG: helix-turn-helix transcriptional regulator [Mesorhizobium sp.]